jgi:hypothetical protein
MYEGINPELIRQAHEMWAQKRGFVAAGDPAMGGAPPGGDPAAAGGAPPGGDPAAAGGAPPGAGGGGGDPMATLMPMIQQMVQQTVAAQGGGMGGQQSGPQQGGPGIKPKIDVNVEIMQIKKMLARIVDHLGIHIPAQEMVATPEDLNQIAQGGAGYAAMTPDGGQKSGLGQIGQISPMKAAEAGPWDDGDAFDLPTIPQINYKAASDATHKTGNLATALLLRNRNKNAG